MNFLTTAALALGTLGFAHSSFAADACKWWRYPTETYHFRYEYQGICNGVPMVFDGQNYYTVNVIPYTEPAAAPAPATNPFPCRLYEPCNQPGWGRHGGGSWCRLYEPC